MVVSLMWDHTEKLILTMAGHKVDNGKREPEEGCPVSKSTTEDAEQPPCHEEDMGPRQNVVEDTKKTSRRITLYKLFKLMAYFWTIMGGVSLFFLPLWNSVFDEMISSCIIQLHYSTFHGPVMSSVSKMRRHIILFRH